jgi:hypothetical protein
MILLMAFNGDKYTWRYGLADRLLKHPHYAQNRSMSEIVLISAVVK